MTAGRTIAIVGGGFSGTLLAITLLRDPDTRVLLVEQDRERLARGLAYGTENPEHVLNVRASNMSAFADDLGHFLRWLGDEGQGAPNRFVPRRIYGRYLAEQLAEAQRAAPGRLLLVDGCAVEAAADGDGWRLGLADGSSHRCDALVLAQGNLPPARLAMFEALGDEVYAASPWQAGIAEGLGPEDEVLLVGAGLTAIDAALSLDAAGFRGKITALSRRGLRPRAHAPVGPDVRPVDPPQQRGATLVGDVRQRARAVGWRSAVDELRPFTQGLWRSMAADERQRFLRHLRPYWDAHRHRLAPAVDRRVEDLQMAGRLTFAGGKIVGVERRGDLAHVEWRVRGTDAIRGLSVRRIVNCTGPSGDLAACDDALLHGLLATGQLRQDPLGLGVEVDGECRVLDARGQAQSNLVALGPMTRGAFWEVVAVPDIRRQVWDIAHRFAARQAGERAA